MCLPFRLSPPHLPGRFDVRDVIHDVQLEVVRGAVEGRHGGGVQDRDGLSPVSAEYHRGGGRARDGHDGVAAAAGLRRGRRRQRGEERLLARGRAPVGAAFR